MGQGIKGWESQRDTWVVEVIIEVSHTGVAVSHSPKTLEAHKRHCRRLLDEAEERHGPLIRVIKRGRTIRK